jgi:hypothetical protein
MATPGFRDPPLQNPGYSRDEDRLPWLDTIVADEPQDIGVGRTVALVLIGLAVLGAVIFGIYRLQRPAGDGGGQVIAAPAGDYKVRPDDPGGLKVKGEGDSAIAASAGSNMDAAIDLRAVPEAPIARQGATATASVAARDGGTPKTRADVPIGAAPLRAQRPMTAPVAAVPGATSGGTLVQLGAFPSAGAANAAWSAIAKRFGYVATLTKSVEEATVNDRKVFRLRVDAGSAAAAANICGRLKVAGESCFVTG